MALPPGNPDTFMAEVDDAVRADRVQGFVRDYGRWLAGAIVIGLAGLGGTMWWQSRTDAGAGDRGAQLSSALDNFGQGRPKAAGDAVEPLAKGEDTTYAALALMVQGNSAAAANDARTAAARFGAVANNANAPQALRDAAMLRQTLAEYDTLPPATVIARLRNLVANDGPAFASAAELTALAELKRGNEAAAGALFQRIARAENVPDSLKSRAVQMAGMLGVDAVQTPDSATAAPAAAGGATPARAAPAATSKTKTGE
jgi:hypothetical protein